MKASPITSSLWLVSLSLMLMRSTLAGNVLTITNPLFSDSKSNLMALVRDEFNTGPDAQVHQLLLWRESSDGFQFLRKWLTRDEFLNADAKLIGDNLHTFDEVLSVVGDHFVRVHFRTRNLLEWRSQNGDAAAELGVRTNRAMIARLFRGERAYCSMLAGCGIAAVSNVVRQINVHQYAVSTFSGSEAVLYSNYDATSSTMEFWLDYERFKERSQYYRVASDVGLTPGIVLSSERKKAISQNNWHRYLEARFVPIPPELPSVQEVHTTVYKAATDGSWSWNVYSNHVFLAVEKDGSMKPGIRALKQNGEGSPHHSEKRRVVLIIIIMLSVLGGASLFYTSRKSGTGL